MHLFHHRPLALAACLFVLCSVFIYRTDRTTHVFFLFLVLAAILIFACICIVKRRVGKHGIVCFLCLGALLISSTSSFFFFKVRLADAQSLVGEPITVRGSVEERLDSGAFYSQFRIRVDHINGEAKDFGALLECEYPSSLQRGDAFEIRVTPRAFTKSDLFNEKNFRLSEGCLLILQSDSSDDCQRRPKESESFWEWTSRLNVKESYSLYQNIGREGGGLCSALLLGNRNFLSSVNEGHFRYAGVSHLLALSGLHVSILVGFLELVLNKLRIAKLCRAILIPMSAVGYLFLTGCSVSAIRAVLMVCFLYVAFLWRGEYDSFTALMSSLVLILFLMPYSVLSVSMWLSYAAAGGIIVFVPFLNRILADWKEKSRLPRFAVSILSKLFLAAGVGVIANVVLLPISAAVFGEVSLLSVPATLLLSIPITLLLVLTLVVFLCPFLPLLPDVCNLLGEFVLSTVAEMSRIPGVLVPLRDKWCEALLMLLVLSLVLLAVLKIKRKVWMLLPLALCVAIVAVSFLGMYREASGEWQMSAIKAGHGEVRLYTKNQQAVLIHDSYGIANSSFEIKDAANKAGCTEIQAIIFCKNYNQATYFISSLTERIRVQKIYLQTPRTEADFAMLDRIYEEAQKHEISVYLGAEEQILIYEPPLS